MCDAGAGEGLLVPVSKASKRLGIDARTLRAAGAREEIPCFRIGRSWWVLRSWVTSFEHWVPPACTPSRPDAPVPAVAA
jgi:hypothetical protein